MSTYGHLFDSSLSEVEIDFDKAIVQVTEDNKHLVLPILFKMIERESQREQLMQVCERMAFDIAALEAGCSPYPSSDAQN